MVWTVFTTILACYILLLIIVYLFQARLIFHPNKSLEVTPAEAQLHYENISFFSSDGVKLTGWYIPSEKSNYVILFCHGNAGNISHRLETIILLHKLGFNIFIFDYRGYGHSEGKTSEIGTYLDSEAAWNYLIKDKKVSPNNIIIWGRSLGGSIAARLASRFNPSITIIESTFTTIIELGKQLYPYLPIKLLCQYHYPTIEYVKEIKSPILFVHSTEDQMIPFSHGLKLYESAHNPKDFLEISGTHNKGYFQSGQLYEKGLINFFKKNNIVIKSD